MRCDTKTDVLTIKITDIVNETKRNTELTCLDQKHH
jgi:hypothetical protein